MFTGTTFIPHDLHFSETVTCDKFNCSDGSAMLPFEVCLAVRRSVFPLARLSRFVPRSLLERQDLGFPDAIFFLRLDLADLPSIKTTAEGFTSKETNLHTLYNNGPARF